MRFSHAPETFHKLWKRMSHTHGHDQIAINQEFAEQIVELPAKFNVHGPNPKGVKDASAACGEAVIGHYTGTIKPTDSKTGRPLTWVRDGLVPDTLGYGCASSCPPMYKKLFCAMKE